MGELVDLAGPDEFVLMPGLFELGVEDLGRALENLQELDLRVVKAVQAGCYLEAISLRLQYIELSLRSFWLIKNRQGKLLDPEDKRTFGQFIEDCARLGFDADLVKELQIFNKHRINAIHRYLLGAVGYEVFESVWNESATLPKRVLQYTGKIIGLPLKNQ
jgi:hypothetical protein